MLPINFISDLEAAIVARSNNTGAMLHQITDLFLLHAGHYSSDQLAAYDEILKLLIDKVDTAAREALACSLSAARQAPAGTIRSLALDESIEVAEPVLTQSTALSDDTLIECIASRGQKHMLAIATRNSLSETICDQLICNGDRNVLIGVVQNPGASISEPSYGVLVDRSTADDWLSECIALRPDLPEHHFRELVSKASEIVRQRLIVAHPQKRELIGDVIPSSLLARVPAAGSKVKDYRLAELVIREQPVTETLVSEFAAQKKMDEVFVSIAHLSGLTPSEIERVFMETWSSPVAVIFKAIGFHLGSLQAVYHARLPSGVASGIDLTRVKAEFIALRRATAERILRFYRIRKTGEASTEQPI
jgi:Uncharacterised protein conserved in bacteria (DUF2336)